MPASLSGAARRSEKFAGHTRLPGIYADRRAKPGMMQRDALWPEQRPPRDVPRGKSDGEPASTA
jgi:hypothetical protein